MKLWWSKPAPRAERLHTDGKPLVDWTKNDDSAINYNICRACGGTGWSLGVRVRADGTHEHLGYIPCSCGRPPR